MVCRLDGPSHAVLLPHTADAEVRALADQIRARVGRLQIQPPKVSPDAAPLPPITVTAKTGVASATEVYDRSLLERAQDEMSAPVRRAA